MPDLPENEYPYYDPDLYHPEFYRKKISDNLPQDYKKLRKARIKTLSMVMISQAPSNRKNNFVSIYRRDNHAEWGIGFLCFPDRNQLMLIIGGDLQNAVEIEGCPCVPFLVTPDIRGQLTTLDLIAHIYGGLKQAQDIETEAYRVARINKTEACLERMTRVTCVLESLVDFLAFDTLSEIHELIGNHDFFPLERSTANEAIAINQETPVVNTLATNAELKSGEPMLNITPTPPALLSPQEPYTISLGNIKDWEQAEGLLTLYPPFFSMYGELLERMKRSPNTRLFVAFSNLEIDDPQQEPTMLGCLIAGYPFSEYNTSCYIMALVVLPDERRRGIARQLLRRFFSHAAITHARVNFLLDRNHPAYEYAQFFKSQGGVILGHNEAGIQFLLRNQNLGTAQEMQAAKIVHKFQELGMPYQKAKKKRKKDTEDEQET